MTFPEGGGIGFQNTGIVVANQVIVFGPGQRILIYSGTPAFGNLIGSWAGTAGTDPFGNAYPAGLNVTQGSISGTTFSGTDFIINNAGMFFYSGTPALGNLILAIAPRVAGTDGFGNVYPQGTTFGVWDGTGALTQNFTIGGVSGNIALNNSTNKTVIKGYAADGSMLFYTAAGLGLGNMNVAIAPAAGSDAQGNAYVQGVTIKNAGQIATIGTGGAEILEEINAGNPQKFWLSGYANESSGASIFSQLINIGMANEYIQWWMFGPKVTGQKDAVFVLCNSSHNDATNNAFGSLGYIDTGGTANGMLNWGPAGINGMGQLTAVTPGTGTVLIDATAETWHSIPLAATWTALGSGTTAPEYRQNAIGMFDVKGDIIFTSTGVGLSGSNSFSTAIPAAYRPAEIQYFPAYVIGGSDTPVITANRSPIVELDASGIFHLLNVSSTGTAGHTVQFGFKGSYQIAD